MPLKTSERHTETFTRLSTSKAAPRAPMTGRWAEPSRAWKDANNAPAPSQYQKLRDWGTTSNARGPRIGARSLGPAHRLSHLDPDTMLGSHLRSKQLNVPQYDVPPGVGSYTPRKPAAVMCGTHSSAREVLAGTANDTSTSPSPMTYVSDYDTIARKALSNREEAVKSSDACTFGRRAKDASDTGVPGPGSYDDDFTKTMSPGPADDLKASRSNRGARSRPTTVQSDFSVTSRGKSMTGRWPERTLVDPSPGPGEYTPTLPFIGSAAARAPSIKGRLAHPFVDSLATHECARSDHAHSGRRFKARVRAT